MCGLQVDRTVSRRVDGLEEFPHLGLRRAWVRALPQWEMTQELLSDSHSLTVTGRPGSIWLPSKRLSGCTARCPSPPRTNSALGLFSRVGLLL